MAERCIYAVDLDPLAVELCRLSLWIETMDRTLPFGFLDHKIKCGNALIGAWFDQFRHYPVMAWKNREGGDKNHTNGVHFKGGARTKAIKAFVKDKLKPDLELFLQGADLFQEDLLEESLTVHDDALAVLADMHALPVQDGAERTRMYRERLLGSSAWRSLKRAMDLWCACLFWPPEETERAPLPSTLGDPAAETRAVAERIATEMRFFHWEYVRGTASERGLKLAMMDITSSTNARTMIAAPVADMPCGNKTPLLTPSSLDVAQRIDLIALTTSIRSTGPFGSVCPELH